MSQISVVQAGRLAGTSRDHRKRARVTDLMRVKENQSESNDESVRRKQQHAGKNRAAEQKCRSPHNLNRSQSQETIMMSSGSTGTRARSSTTSNRRQAFDLPRINKSNGEILKASDLEAAASVCFRVPKPLKTRMTIESINRKIPWISLSCEKAYGIGDGRRDATQDASSLDVDGRRIAESVETITTTVVKEDQVKSKSKRVIATYFKQNFYNKDITCQTELVGEIDDDSDDAATDRSNDESDYDLFGEIASPTATGDLVASKHSAQPQIQVSSVESRKTSTTRSPLVASHRNTSLDKVIACATAAVTSNFSPQYSCNIVSTSKNSNLETEPNSKQGSKYKRTLFNYPDLPEQSDPSRSSGSSNHPSSSGYSDAFDTASGSSKVKLTGSRSRAPTVEQAPQSLHLSIDMLRLMVERNLVATLVSVYILVSLTVIMVLILPYLFNMPRAITIDGGVNEQLMSHQPFKQQGYDPFDERPATESKGTQTLRLQDDILLSDASAFSSSKAEELSHNHQSEQTINSSQLTSSKRERTTNTPTDSIPRDLRYQQLSAGSQKARETSQLNSSAKDNHKERITIIKALQIADMTNKAKPRQNNSEIKREQLVATASPPSAEAAQQGRKHRVNHQPLISSKDSASGKSKTSGFHREWNVVHNQQCQPLVVPFCTRSFESIETNTNSQARSASTSNSQMFIPYDKTLVPNQFTTIKQSAIERTLSKFEPVIDIKCYALMPLFLCSIYAPKCVPVTTNQTTNISSDQQFVGGQVEVARSANERQHHGVKTRPVSSLAAGSLQQASAAPTTSLNHSAAKTNSSHAMSWARLVPPCRSLCKEALRKCMFFFEVLSLQLLEPADCEHLPESSDPNVCLGQEQNNQLQRAAESQSCQEDKFRCTDGECIPKKWRCDGFADCTDKSDEQKCSKCNVVTQFYCGQDTCINKEQVCNGIKDCRDGRDERQCLRLANVEGLKRTGRLEVWSALKDTWIPFCGAHWSAMPMSHEACQALGYSRANETLILFEAQPAAVKGLVASRATSGGVITSTPPATTPATAKYARLTHSNSSGSLLVHLDASGSKLDLLRRLRSPSYTWLVDNGGSSAADNYSSSLSGVESSGAFTTATDNEQLASSVVDDISTMGESAPIGSTTNKINRNNRAPDHLVSYERIGSSLNEPNQLASIDAAEIKLKSLTSVLYHGPQTGCADRPSHLVSTVHLQCKNFQCGRPITSYSSRVRLQQQQQQQPVQVQQDTIPVGVKRLNSGSPALRSQIGATRRSVPMLEATGDDDDDDDDEPDPPEYSDKKDTNDNDSEPNEERITTGAEELRLIDKIDQRQKQDQAMAVNSEVNSRLVVGGFESIPGEFPYLAALHGGPDEVFFCGGVVISLNWLLTAAHCVGNRTQPDGWMVKVGVTRRIASPAFVRKLKVHKIIKHPGFNAESMFNNDIALILLEESVEFNQYLRPICLPRANLKLGPDNSKDCVVVGFGKSKFSQEANYLHVAHFVNVPIVRHSICSSWYSEHNVNLTEGMLCAGYAEGKRDACQGDSGSGLFCRYSNTNQFFVAGVVSFGIKCATPKLPGVYTSVPLYVDWIETTTRQHGYPLS